MAFGPSYFEYMKASKLLINIKNFWRLKIRASTIFVPRWERRGTAKGHIHDLNNLRLRGLSRLLSILIFILNIKCMSFEIFSHGELEKLSKRKREEDLGQSAEVLFLTVDRSVERLWFGGNDLI